MKKHIIYLFLIVSTHIKSQDLHIYYNAFTDSIWYVKDAKSVANPIIRKGRQVVLHVEEFNNYIYNSTFESKQLNKKPLVLDNSMENHPKNIIDAMTGYLEGNVNQIPLISNSFFGGLLKSLSGAQQEGVSRSDISMIQEFNNQLESVERHGTLINTLIGELNVRKRTLNYLEMGLSELQKMQQNPEIRPSEIRKFLLSFYSEVLQLEKSGDLTSADLMERNKDLQELGLLQQSIKHSIENFKKTVQELYKIKNTLRKTEFNNGAISKVLRNLETEETQFSKYLMLTELSISQSIIAPSKDYYNQLLEIYMAYLELKNNNFTQKYNLKAESEYIYMYLKLTGIDTMRFGMLGSRAAKSKSISLVIRSFGDFLMSTSAGIALCKLSNSPQKYFDTNGFITAQNLDQYIPVFKSLLNFSYTFNSSVNPCLSIGIGVPISSLEQQTSLNYFVGGGLFVGRTSKLQLNFGLMFSKQLQLANGFKIGDPIQLGDGVIPTEFKYQQGLYFGIAFNLK